MKSWTWGFYLCGALLLACSPRTRRIAAADLPGQVTKNSAQKDATKLLRDVARAAEGAGAQQLTVLGFGAATPGDRVEAMVHVPKSTCALFFSRATDSVEDLDLHIYGDDGSQFGVDETPDDLPTLLLCPEGDVRLFASARVAQGEGLVALGVQTVSRQDAPAVAQAVGARNFATPMSPVDEPWPGLNEALEERRASLGGRFSDQRRVALPIDSRVPTHLTAEVPAGRCLDVLILPDSDTSGLELKAFDDLGRIFARGDALAQRRALLLCSAHDAQSVTLELRPFAGRGVSVAALSVSAGPVSSLDLAPHVVGHLVDRGQPAQDRDELPRARSTTKRQLERGEIHSQALNLRGCARLDFLPDSQLLDFRAQLWDAQGLLLGETSGLHGTPIFACAKGTVRLDLEARERSGTLTVELRPSEDSPETLLHHPLAASRLLRRAHDSGYLSLPEQIGRVTSIELSSTTLTRIPLTVPAAHCQTVFFGGGHGAFGLEARAVDNATGLDLDRNVGHTSLQLRACAPMGGNLAATLEIRTTSGATSALWAARQERIPPNK